MPMLTKCLSSNSSRSAGSTGSLEVMAVMTAWAWFSSSWTSTHREKRVAAAISSAGNHSLAWAVALWIAAVSWAVNASRVTPSCNQTPLRLDD